VWVLGVEPASTLVRPFTQPRKPTPGTTSLPMRIAKPLLLTLTPIGVAWGLVEAWRFRPVLALLMALLLSVVGMFVWMTVRRIRIERQAGDDPPR
jgi:hypothetical protein